jgi:uncharacterized membrane protein YjgN (DUF898 family)
MSTGATPTAAGSGVDTLRLRQEGRARQLLPIVAVNAFLTLVTFTIYRFWAKTRVRDYLWSTTKLLDDRFEYTGRGIELFIGFLIVLLVVLLPLGLIAALARVLLEQEELPKAVGLFLFLYLAGFYLTGVAIYRAQRYRYSRTRWRGIRPALTGSSWLYGLIFIAVQFLNGATMGWARPWGRLRLMQQMVDNSYFGDRPFSLQGGAGPLYRPYAVYWFGRILVIGFGILLLVLVGGGLGIDNFAEAPPAKQAVTILAVALVVSLAGLPLALLYAFYKARELAYIVACTTLEGLRFRFETSTWSLTRLACGNYLILILTLGLGYPFAQLRNFRYLADRLSAAGNIDLDAIKQSAEAMPRYGEGLADAFDVGSV